MSKFMLPAQTLIYTTLTAGLSYPVYDDVPDLPIGMPNDSFPYVALGHDYTNSFDTDNWNGEKVSVQLDVWSRYNGKLEVKTILSEIYALLHKQALTQAGVSVVDCLHVYSTIPDTGASNYVHGIARYEITLTEVI